MVNSCITKSSDSSSVTDNHHCSSTSLNRFEFVLLLILGLLTLSTIPGYQALIPASLIVLSSLRQLLGGILELPAHLSVRRASVTPEGGHYPVVGRFHAWFYNLTTLINAELNSPVLKWRLLGILLPIASIFPKGALTLSAITCVLLDSSRRRVSKPFSDIIRKSNNSNAEHIVGDAASISPLRPISVFRPYLLVCLSWIALAAFYEIPFSYLQHLVGLLFNYPRTFFSLSKLTPVTASLVEGMAPFILLLIIWGRLSEKTQKGKAMLVGILFSWTIALLWVVLQAVGVTQWPSKRNSDFWLQQGRFWGTFSDPNAFGVFSIILISLISSIGLNRKVKIIFVLATSLVALLSGSRSFVMGLFVLGLFWTFEKREILKSECVALFRKREIVKVLLFATLCLSLFVAILKPSGLERILHSINPETAAAAFFSRAVFWKSCLWIWSNFPIIGGGLGSFRENFPRAVEHFGLDLNGWIDNANNFYLGILAELGLLGFIPMLCALISLRWRNDCFAPLQRAPLLISGLLLFFGPHLDFMEVAILLGLVLSTSVVAPEQSARSHQMILRIGLGAAIVSIVLVLASERERDYGVFAPVKRSGDIATLEKPIWLAPKASIIRPCIGGKIKLLVTDERSAAALKHRYFGGGGDLNRVSFVTSHQSLTVELLNESQLVELDCHDSLQRISVVSSTPWIPALSRSGKDTRFLGVKLRQQDPG